MSTQKVHSALNAHLLDVSPIKHIAWENTAYTPAAGQMYIRPTFMPGEARQVTLGASRIERQVGVYQIDTFIPAGNGIGEAEDMATYFVHKFDEGTCLEYSGIQATITKSYQAKGFLSDGWYILPVKIHWQADFYKGD